MKLPIPSVFTSKKKSSYFLSLLLRDEKATAVIIEEQGGSIRIVNKHEEYFTTPIEEATEEEWLEVLDKTISRAEEVLPANVETEKTVFGVKDSWVEEKRIKREYLLKLKKVCEALALTPIGFLVISEAITHLMQEEEGAPVSALLTDVGKTRIILSLIRAGKIIETKSIPRGEHIPTLVDAALKGFSVDVLPSRIIVFDGDETEKLSQTFISHQWSKSLPFLHMPQISILPAGFDAKAVVFGAALQMGFAVVGGIVDKTGQDIKPIEQKHLPREEKEKEKVTTSENKEEKTEQPIEKVDKEDALEQSAPLMDAGSFGFLSDVDVAEAKNTPEPEEPPQEPTEPIKETKEAKQSIPTSDSLHIEDGKTFEEVQKHEAEQTYAIHQHEERQHPSGEHSAGTNRLASIIPSISLPHFSFPRGRGIFLIPIVLFVLVGFIAAYIFLIKATITLTVKPEVVDQTETITFSAKADNNTEERIISAKKVSTALEGTASTDATGKKETGNKAKGTVTLYNSSDTKKQLSEGATITSSNGLDFVVDKDVTVSSASGDIFSGIKSGTAQVGVSAKAIGSEYNLPSNTKFSVAGISSLAAKNDTAFSGGSKKQITVVAKSDIEKLTAALPKSLEQKGRSDIEKKIGDDETTLPLFLSETLEKKSFTKDVGEEAKTVTLKAQVTFESLAYKNDDLNALAKTIIAHKSSSNQSISEKGLKNTLKGIKQKNDDEITASLAVNAGLLPKVDTEKLKAQLKGKSFTDTEDELTNLSQVQGVDIALRPNLPFLPKMLPRLEKNISITVKTDE